MPVHPSGDVDAPEAAETMCAMASYERRTRRLSGGEYERLVDLGVFQPGESIELTGGELMVALPRAASLRPGLRLGPLSRLDDEVGELGIHSHVAAKAH